MFSAESIFSGLLGMWKGFSRPARIISFGPDGDALCGIEGTWSDDRGICVKGWAVGRDGPVENIDVTVDGASAPVTRGLPRRDVTLAHPFYRGDRNCGFVVYAPRVAEHEIKVDIRVGGRTFSDTIRFAGPGPEEQLSGGKLYKEFIGIVNRERLSVLEVGSRVVSPGSKSKRPLFSGASSYTGFDIYPDDNTDVVGDAHKLAGYFNGRRFGAVFSLSVFEHLAMPWVVAREINRVLEVGGYTYHATHFSWPLHEPPWDFWRFTDEGLRALFSPALGFEVLKAGFFSPLRLHVDKMLPGQEELAFQPAYGGVAVLAKKVRDVDEGELRWETTLDKVVGKHSHYPKP